MSPFAPAQRTILLSSRAGRRQQPAALCAVKRPLFRKCPHGCKVLSFWNLPICWRAVVHTTGHTTGLRAVVCAPWSCQSVHWVWTTRTWCSFERLLQGVPSFCLVLCCHHRATMHSDSAVPHDSVQLVDGFPSDISLRKCQSDPVQS